MTKSSTSLLTQKQRDIGRDFNKYEAIAKIYGDKAAGLSLLPTAWAPKFIAISVDVHRHWKKTQKINFSQFRAELEQWLQKLPNGSCIILRSSGVGETLKDRGSLQSILIENANLSKIKSAASQIFAHAATISSEREMGLVLQLALAPDAAGQFSNETSVTPTRNQWKYEAELPTWSPPQGLNSKFAPLPDTKVTLRSRGSAPHDALRSLGQWLNSTVEPRCHVEWVASDSHLWVVQVDLEWMEKDVGIDPEKVLKQSNFEPPDLSALRVFSLYRLGEQTKSKKLANLNDFDFSSENVAPNLFFASGSDIAAALASDRELLAKEIDALTNAKCVIRTDILDRSGFNFPRTDTLSGTQAIEWLSQQLEDFRQKQIPFSELVFVLHAFLPALSAAWAYADPNDPLVLVDSLWGLPDGLQFLPHDSFQVDRVREKIVSRKNRYKPRFLMENDDGTWSYEDVLVLKARRTSLESKDVVEIAVRTAEIAEKVGGPAQIMWFCGIPKVYALGRNIPWFRARETADPPPRHELRHKPVTIERLDDLKRLITGPYTISLMPDIRLVRNEEFIDAVIETARSTRSAVSLQGSLLGHTFYKLSAAGIAVILHDPVQHYRKRGRKTFGKLVRDKIPDGIAQRGEIVREAVLDPRDMIAGLTAKLCEESVELLTADGRASQTEELSDILELVLALSATSGISLEEIQASADRKREKRGGFLERKVLLETSLPMPGNTPSKVPEVNLRDIAHVIAKGGNAFIPFAAIFANSDGLSLDIEALRSSSHVRLRLMPGGIRMEAITDPSSEEATQIDMFAEDPVRSRD